MENAGRELKHQTLMNSIGSLQIAVKHLVNFRDKIIGEVPSPTLSDERKQAQETVCLAKVMNEASDIIQKLTAEIEEIIASIDNSIF